MKVKLDKSHTHAGEQKTIGDVIDVSYVERNWLTEQGVINAENSAAPAATINTYIEDESK